MHIIKGTVISNDGDKALVKMANGEEKWFTRGTAQPIKHFQTIFATGAVVPFQHSDSEPPHYLLTKPMNKRYIEMTATASEEKLRNRQPEKHSWFWMIRRMFSFFWRNWYQIIQYSLGRRWVKFRRAWPEKEEDGVETHQR